MARRFKMKKKTSKRLFKKFAGKTHKSNLKPTSLRGGGRK